MAVTRETPRMLALSNSSAIARGRLAVANPIGRWRRKALETRRSPYTVGEGGLFCQACTKQAVGVFPANAVWCRPCRVYQDGLLRPGVRCPRCGAAWVEQEEQPEKVS